MPSPAPAVTELISAPPGHVVIGPVPDWVAALSFDSKMGITPGEAFTHLLLSRQIHAETRQTHFHSAVRLETAEGVKQHAHWQVDFDAQTQSVTVHWIRVRRGTDETNHAVPGRIQVASEEIAPGDVPNRVSALLDLDGLQPGDIVEVSFTIEGRLRILSERAQAYFALPPYPVAKYRFSLRFDPVRPMKSTAFSDTWKPAESREDGAVEWTWEGENYRPRTMEPNTPRWHFGYPWVQFSDIPDWPSVSAAFDDAWKTQSDEGGLGEIAAEISGNEPDILAQVNRAIEFVQDQIRHAPANSEFDSVVPSSPASVLRRRYGDSTDLSLLLVRLLRKLGVSAQPVLINSRLQKKIARMLPGHIFEHAIVEFQMDGQRRWVDPTMKWQGGGALNRFIPDFGVGLAVDGAGGGLIEPPAEQGTGTLQVRDTLLLDTTGAFSILATVTKATGAHADSLRRQFEITSIEDIKRQRLQACANRFSIAQRSKPMRWRDDRVRNEFVIAEIFEVKGFLKKSAQADACVLPLPPAIPVETLPAPENTKREAPYGLPYPCHVVHVIELQCSALQAIPYKQVTLTNAWLQFRRSHQHLYRHWEITFDLSVRAKAVPVNKLDEYLESLRTIREASLLELTIRTGHPHPRQRNDFGAMPSSPNAISIKQSQPAAPVRLMAASASSSKVLGTVTLSKSMPMPSRASAKKNRMQAGMGTLPASASTRIIPPASKSGSSRRSSSSGHTEHGKHRRHRRKAWKKSARWSWIGIGLVAVYCVYALNSAIKRRQGIAHSVSAIGATNHTTIP